jgi:hypothetical protein
MTNYHKEIDSLTTELKKLKSDNKQLDKLMKGIKLESSNLRLRVQMRGAPYFGVIQEFFPD